MTTQYFTNRTDALLYRDICERRGKYCKVKHLATTGKYKYSVFVYKQKPKSLVGNPYRLFR